MSRGTRIFATKQHFVNANAVQLIAYCAWELGAAWLPASPL